MRKLASVRRIANILPIPDADAIEVAVVDGWKVVVKKNEYRVGDLAVYLEIDSWVPHELAPFLSKNAEPREYNGVRGERLRTVRLRGQISQGLLLKTTDLKFAVETKSVGPDSSAVLRIENLDHEGADLTELLGIQKWEPEIPAQLAGQVRGLFPTHLIPKTDQERIQNCFEDIKAKGDVDYEASLKLDGTSCTIFRWEGELRVASRNLELKINEENAGNTLVAMALKIGDKIPNGYAFQGELCGPGIQGNREGFGEHKFFVFDIFIITDHQYVTPEYRIHKCQQLKLNHVPVLGTNWKAPASVEEGLALAEGPSINHKIREGIVWKCNQDPKFSFKTISNKYLLSGGD